MEITDAQLKQIKDLFTELKGLNDFYSEQYKNNPNNSNKASSDYYGAQETGVAKVLDILRINY